MIEAAARAAKHAGSILRESFRRQSDYHVDLKGIGDYVTNLDREAENIIIQEIKKDFPDHSICAEESGLNLHSSESPVWYIDPLDGTANYVHGIPVFAVSIACEVNGILETGVIYDPFHDEMFSAERGKGAFLNGRQISVNQSVGLPEAMLATGFPWRTREWISPYFKCADSVLKSCSGMRRLGVAAVDLAWTACGRFDGFWEMLLKPWDIAAGALIVQEAGGIVTDFKNGKDYLHSGNIIAAPAKVHPALLNLVSAHLGSI